MTYSILVVEDEPSVAQRLTRLSADILGMRLAGSKVCPSLADAEAWLANNDADLVFLDLNLAGMDGFDLLKRFAAKAAHTIIVSAQTDRAVEAFEFGVLDFVPKPFTRLRLEKALARLLCIGPPPDQASTRYLSFETRDGIEVIGLADILFFRGADKYSEAMLGNGTVRFHGKSLNRLEEILGGTFVRTHKSYLVHQAAITDLKSLEGSRYELILATGDSLPVGRTRVDHIRHLLA